MRLHFVERSSHAGLLISFCDVSVARSAFGGVCIGSGGRLMCVIVSILLAATRGNHAENRSGAKGNSQSKFHENKKSNFM
jgi:hypothetical protein